MGSLVQEKVLGFDQVTSKKEEKSEQNSLHVEKHAHLFAEGDNLRMKVDSQFQLIWFASSSGSVWLNNKDVTIYTQLLLSNLETTK